uniref:RNA helicase n=1 Tax=Chromera velia CCMP2878 TaxID=1169474 RepID=A0A0G4HB85_9ALVE|eukprot:Cvel_25764.t1-p1 / transcript=Cvel_25764.t1 / gene=Cvel_25764 / organism=Chromera_velia_CCMP2878 / gene_product=DEAD-box ATP-dependent RNA helicase 53, putative / transcript_product=DEAD-box ATP-dependent RNA helicase 53, putative / location=Cvel_scaffold2967:19379-21757(+) / protein_length=793 / sequence_SO=supercontig / SO=protein_coding / is_pseudo=false
MLRCLLRRFQASRLMAFLARPALHLGTFPRGSNSRGLATAAKHSRRRDREGEGDGGDGGTDAPHSHVRKVDKLPLSPHTKTALSDMGVKRLFDIQALAFDPILMGRDFVGRSKTGTGKTLAYLLPLMERLKTEKMGKKHPVLILVPTRELAKQVASVILSLSPSTDVALLYGGSASQSHEEMLRLGAEVVVGTPGRCALMLKKNALHASNLRVIVFDEADVILSQAFSSDVQSLLEACRPQRVQSVLFTASLTKDLRSIVDTHFQNAVRVDTVVMPGEGETIGGSPGGGSSLDGHAAVSRGRQSASWGIGGLRLKVEKGGQRFSATASAVVLNVRHAVCKVPLPDALSRTRALLHLLAKKEAEHIAAASAEMEMKRNRQLAKGIEPPEGLNPADLSISSDTPPSFRALVFAGRPQRAESLAQHPALEGRARPFHGGLDQETRERTLNAFASGSVSVLCCTDLAARGLDFPAVSLVVHYGLPADPNVYLHRAGRTGRAGRSGESVLLYAGKTKEREVVKRVEGFANFKFEKEPLPAESALLAGSLARLTKDLSAVPPEEWLPLKGTARALLREMGPEALSTAFALLDGRFLQGGVGMEVGEGKGGTASLLTGRPGFIAVEVDDPDHLLFSSSEECRERMMRYVRDHVNLPADDVPKAVGRVSKSVRGYVADLSAPVAEKLVSLRRLSTASGGMTGQRGGASSLHPSRMQAAGFVDPLSASLSVLRQVPSLLPDSKSTGARRQRKKAPWQMRNKNGMRANGGRRTKTISALGVPRGQMKREEAASQIKRTGTVYG